MSVHKAKVVIILMAAVLLLTALAGCGRAPSKEVLIGTAVSLTGKGVVAGTCARNAYELAIKEVNDEGGIQLRGLARRLPVKLIVYDDESNPEISARLVKRLITEDKVDALLGGYGSTIVEPQSEVAEKHHVPFVNGGGADSHIYSKGYGWIFATCPSVKRGATTVMDFIREHQEEGNLPDRLRIAMVWEDTRHGEDFRNGIEQRAAEFPDNFQIVLDKSFPLMAADFTSLLEEVEKADADVFLNDAHLADFMLIHQQYTDLGLSHLLVSYGARGSEEVARDTLGYAVDYLVSFAWWSENMPYPHIKEFVSKYETSYDKAPEWYAGAPYEAARALLQAIEDAGSLDKAKIRYALAHLDMANSILAGQEFSFGQNGQADYPLRVIQNRPDGTSAIVYPADVAGGEAKVPRPRVRFGCALSLSGRLEEEGQLTKEGYELWKEHINSQGGIWVGNDRYLVEILYYDDESDPHKTAALVERLITEDEVHFLLGPYGSNCTFEAAAIAERYRVPMVEGGGAAEKIFASGFKYTFGLLSLAGNYFQSLLEGAVSLDPRPNKVAIISASDLFSLSAAEGAKQHAERLGFEVTSFIIVETEEELSSTLSALKDDKPEIVLLSAHFEEALSFVRTSKTVGLSPEMFGIAVAPCLPAFVQELGEDAEYIFGTAQWTSALPHYGSVFGTPQDYAQLFCESFGKEPDYHSAVATACGVTYQLALEKASCLDREKVRDALVSLDAMTFYGRIKFNQEGVDIYNPMVAVQIQQGGVVTIWPEQLSTGSGRYPTPPWGEREPD